MIFARNRQDWRGGACVPARQRLELIRDVGRHSATALTVQVELLEADGWKRDPCSSQRIAVPPKRQPLDLGHDLTAGISRLRLSSRAV